MNGSTIEILRVLTDKLSTCPSSMVNLAEFYKKQIEKVIDNYCER